MLGLAEGRPLSSQKTIGKSDRLLVSGEGVQSNQFLITDNEQYLLLDPGGDLMSRIMH